MKSFRLILIVVAIILLQTTQFDFFSIKGIKPDFILIIVIYFGLFKGKTVGITMGFTLGLLEDIFSAGILGTNTLIKTLLGYLASVIGEKLVLTNPVTQIIIVFIATLVDGWLTFFILRGAYSGEVVSRPLRGLFLPEAFYNGICSWFLFWALLRPSPKERKSFL